MSTNVNKSTNEYFLTQAQYEARKTAGTLEVGAVYHITDVSYENTSNKVTSISSSSTDTQYPSAKCVYDEVSQLSQDKVDYDDIQTSVSSSSTNAQVPSAKLFYDTMGNVEATLNAIRGVS